MIACRTARLFVFFTDQLNVDVLYCIQYTYNNTEFKTAFCQVVLSSLHIGFGLKRYGLCINF